MWLCILTCCRYCFFQGKNINEEASRLLQEGLDECALWGDIDIQALLMVEGAELKAKRGKTDDSMAMLQVQTHTLFGIFYFQKKKEKNIKL